MDDPDYQALFDMFLPTGVYRVDEHGVVTHANLRFARMHGFGDVEAVKGRPLQELYSVPADAERFSRQADATRRKVILRRANGERFSAFVTNVPFFNAQGEYTGVGGVVEVRREEEDYERLFDLIPIGFYGIEYRGDAEIVVTCNEELARIFDLPSSAEMIGRDARTFHASSEETRQMAQAINDAARNGGVVIGKQLLSKTALGAMKVVEVNARPKLYDGEVVGHVGAMRDISEEVAAREFITTLTDDIGSVLHTFRHTLAQLKFEIAMISDVLAGEPQSHLSIRTPAELEQMVGGPLRALTTAVEGFMAAVHRVHHAVALNSRDLEALERTMDAMHRYKQIPQSHWRHMWCQGAVAILAICSRVKSGTVARSVHRPVIDAARTIASITGAASLSITREAIAAVDAPVAGLYELVTARARAPQSREVVPLEGCVNDAINNVVSFAEERRVRIGFDSSTRTPVEVARVEVTRAIANLLHNAIKYSWHREKGGTRVSVLVTTNYQRAVVSVENWGVPIPGDEIERGLIFRLGFRGRLSEDRGRMGTGVGLADAMRVARTHGGDLRIESRPAVAGGGSTDYRQPFRTTAFFELPVYSRRES
jgi:PAS domain S-box-containing protein